MDVEDPYECLPPTTTTSTHMLAGAAAGVMEHCVFYPVDCVKTRMQSLVPDPKADYRSIPDAFRKILVHEGPKITVRGIGAVVGGAGPAHALYFGSYEHAKTLLKDCKNDSVKHGSAGVVATLLHDAIMVPADVVKQRMQVYGSPYKNTIDCGKTIFKNEGIRAFYRSYTTQLTMNIPFQCIHFITYEKMQDFLNKDRQYSAFSHITAGGIAGATAAVVTMPLDVCKTLLNTQECCSKSNVAYVNGMVSAFQTVYQYQGIAGYFRGIKARVLFQMPATAISWFVYESFKYMLSRKQDIEDKYANISQLTVKDIDVDVPSGPSISRATVSAASYQPKS